MIRLHVLLLILAAIALPANMAIAASPQKRPVLADDESSTPLCQVYTTFFYPINDTSINGPKTSMIASVWENGVCIRTKNDQLEGNAGGLPYDIGHIRADDLKQLKDNLRKALAKDYDRLSKHGTLWLDDVPWISVEINLDGKRYRLESAHELIKWLGPGFRSSEGETETKDFLSFWQKLRELCVVQKYVRLMTIEDEPSGKQSIIRKIK